MSDELRAEPATTLGYHEDRRSAPFRALVGLVLLAGAVSASMDLVGHTSVLLRSWSHARHAVQSAAPSSVEGLSVAVTAAQIFFSICAAAGCVISATTARALVFTVFAEAAIIALLAISILLQISNYVTIGATSQSSTFLVTLLAQMGSTFIHASLIPVMVMIVLLRPDMRPRI